MGPIDELMEYLFGPGGESEMDENHSAGTLIIGENGTVRVAAAVASGELIYRNVLNSDDNIFFGDLGRHAVLLTGSQVAAHLYDLRISDE